MDMPSRRDQEQRTKVIRSEVRRRARRPRGLQAIGGGEEGGKEVGEVEGREGGRRVSFSTEGPPPPPPSDFNRDFSAAESCWEVTSFSLEPPPPPPPPPPPDDEEAGVGGSSDGRELTPTPTVVDVGGGLELLELLEEKKL